MKFQKHDDVTRCRRDPVIARRPCQTVDRICRGNRHREEGRGSELWTPHAQ